MATGLNPVGSIFGALDTLRSELEGLILPLLNQAATASGSISENAFQNILDTLNTQHAKVTSAVTKATGEKPNA